jgi:hypothetical protein
MDQSLFAAPHGLSQRTTSFIASQRQGIHQMPLRHLIALITHAHPLQNLCKTRSPQRDNRHGTVPKTHPMNTENTIATVDQLGRPTMVQRPFNHTRHATDTPAVKRGSPNLAVRDRHDIKKPKRTPNVMPSSMSSLHDNKRTGQRQPKGTPLQTLSLISECFKVSSFHTNQRIAKQAIGGASPVRGAASAAKATKTKTGWLHQSSDPVRRLVEPDGIEPTTSSLQS